MNVLAIVSGGMDSATLAYETAAAGHALRIVSFDYGQRHRKELDAAEAIAVTLGAPWARIDLTSLTRHLPGSALTDPDVDVPHGHYAEQSMRATVVPNRNAMMLAAAFAIASAYHDDTVATAVHAGDHFVYPDCRPEFLEAFIAMESRALDGFHTPALSAPYAHLSKADIVTRGARFGVPFEATWSCYEGGAIHCGRCGTCVERIEAFTLAGVSDPTTYADTSFARTATASR